MDEFLKELAFKIGRAIGFKAINSDLLEAIFYRLFDGFLIGKNL